MSLNNTIFIYYINRFLILTFAQSPPYCLLYFDLKFVLETGRILAVQKTVRVKLYLAGKLKRQPALVSWMLLQQKTRDPLSKTKDSILCAGAAHTSRSPGWSPSCSCSPGPTGLPEFQVNSVCSASQLRNIDLSKPQTYQEAGNKHA